MIKLSTGLLVLMLMFGYSAVQAEVCKDDNGKQISCPCLDANNQEVPGYVKADCSNEETRYDSVCKVTSQPATGTSTTGGPTQTTQSNTTTLTKGGQSCSDLKDDMEACQAQCVPKVTNGSILPGPRDGSTARRYLLGNFLPNLTNSFLIFYMVVGVIFLIVSGIMWIMASGNEEMTEKAKNTIVWAIIGLTVGVLAYVAVQLVININFFA